MKRFFHFVCMFVLAFTNVYANAKEPSDCISRCKDQSKASNCYEECVEASLQNMEDVESCSCENYCSTCESSKALQNCESKCVYSSFDRSASKNKKRTKKPTIFNTKTPTSLPTSSPTSSFVCDGNYVVNFGDPSQSILPKIGKNQACDSVKSLELVNCTSLPCTMPFALSGIYEISENLAIKSNPRIVSLNGILPNLQTIHGDFVIDTNPSLISLQGLERLKETAFLSITNSPNLTSLIGLSNLTSVNGLLKLWDCKSLSSLTGLISIQNIQSLDIRHASSLTSLEGLERISFLTFMILYNNKNLKSLEGLSSVTKIAGGARIVNNPELTNLNGLSNLTELQQLFISKNSKFSSLKGLSNLFAIRKQIYLNQLPSLESLEGLESIVGPDYFDIDNCRHCGVKITNLSKIKTLKGLSNLKKGGDIILMNNENLISLEGLSSLVEVIELVLINLPSLKSLKGLDKLEIALSIYINGAIGLKSLSGIGNSIKDDQTNYVSVLNTGLTSLQGFNIKSLYEIELRGNQQLKSLKGLEGLKKLTILSIHDHSRLESLVGLKSCSINSIYLSNNTALESLQGLQAISPPVLESLEISSSGKLKNLNGLQGLKQLKLLSIMDNPILTSIKELSSALISIRLSIRNNPKLKSLQGLKINPVLYYLEVMDSPSLESLSGLENVNSVLTELTISNNLGLKNLLGLQNLVDVGYVDDEKRDHSIAIVNNPKITSLRDLKQLQSTDEMFIIGPGMDNLQSIIFGKANGGFQTGAVSIRMSKYPSQKMCNETTEFLKSVCPGNFEVNCVTGCFVFPVNQCAHTFVVNFGNPSLSFLPSINCTTIGGLRIENCIKSPCILPEEFNKVEAIESHLMIQNNPALVEIQGLPNLKRIQKGVLHVINNQKLKSLKGLSNLQQVFSSIEIHDNAEMTSLEGLEQISYLIEMLKLTKLPKLTSLNGLKNLGGVGSCLVDYDCYGQVVISQLSSLTSTEGFQNLKTVSELEISSNENLRNIDGFEKVPKISYLRIKENPKLTSYAGLDGLNYVRKALMETVNFGSSNMKVLDLELTNNSLSCVETEQVLNQICILKDGIDCQTGCSNLPGEY